MEWHFIVKRAAATADNHDMRSLRRPPMPHPSSPAKDPFIRVCMYCSRVSDEEGNWKEMDASHAAMPMRSFSHGVCPDCTPRLIADMTLDKQTDSPAEV